MGQSESDEATHSGYKLVVGTDLDLGGFDFSAQIYYADYDDETYFTDPEIRRTVSSDDFGVRIGMLFWF